MLLLISLHSSLQGGSGVEIVVGGGGRVPFGSTITGKINIFLFYDLQRYMIFQLTKIDKQRDFSSEL